MDPDAGDSLLKKLFSVHVVGFVAPPEVVPPSGAPGQTAVAGLCPSLPVPATCP